MHKIDLKIKLLEPVIIADQSGDINFTGTFNYITATTIHGLFANYYIKANNITDAHKDEFFINCFLKRKLIFTNAYPAHENKVFYPCPLSLHTKKGEDNIVHNLIKEEIEETKPLTKFINIVNDNITSYTPETIIYFHHDRDNRIKGQSTEGKIFYYEALKEGQEFITYITGEKKSLLDEFKTCFSSSLQARIGRSRNTQYGLVNISLGEIKSFDETIEIDNKLLITFISPAILYNHCGYPEPSEKVLNQSLKNLIGCDLTIKKSFTNTKKLEQFINVWRLKTPRDIAFSEGSTFLVELLSDDNEIIEKLKFGAIKGIGEKTHLGFGRFKINWFDHNKSSFSLKPATPLKTERPDGPMPDMVKTICSKIAKNKLIAWNEVSALKELNLFTPPRPSNSLLGKLELILQKSENVKSFKNILNELRKPAKDQLEKCTKNKKSLWELLREDVNINVKEDLKHLEPLLRFCQLNSENLKDDLYKSYWLTVFRLLRKER